jgi:hypothetical protein
MAPHSLRALARRLAAEQGGLTIPMRLRIATYSKGRRSASYRAHDPRGRHCADFDLVDHRGVRDREIVTVIVTALALRTQSSQNFQSTARETPAFLDAVAFM